VTSLERGCRLILCGFYAVLSLLRVGCRLRQRQAPQISYDKSAPAAEGQFLRTLMPALACSAVMDAVARRQEGRARSKRATARIETANDAARVEPRRAGYYNAVQIFSLQSRSALTRSMSRPDRLQISHSTGDS